jgi:hypothetical protein
MRIVVSPPRLTYLSLIFQYADLPLCLPFGLLAFLGYGGSSRLE